MSSAYVNNEMQSEFGLIPPAFLPARDMCLYEMHLKYLANPEENVFLTIPEEFEPSDIDLQKLADRKVRLVKLPTELSVLEAFLKFLSVIKPCGGLKIVFGDTFVELCEEDLMKADVVAVQSVETSHPWMHVEPEGPYFYDEPQTGDRDELVCCGYFHLSEPMHLLKSDNQYNLSDGLNFYASRVGLTCMEPKSWLDFGHVPLFYKAKKAQLVSRAHNNISVAGNVLTKASTDTQKVRAEADWYSRLPTSVALHCPRFLGEASIDGMAAYQIEYMHLPSLGELFASGRLPARNWATMFDGVVTLLEKMASIEPSHSMPESQEKFRVDFLKDLIVPKLEKRVEEFSRKLDFKLAGEFVVNGKKFPRLSNVVDEVSALVSKLTPATISIWHGDLFFGNMLYDNRSEHVYCLDPRGRSSSSALSIYGDLRYDLAKLAHSVFCRYDVLISNRFDLQISSLHKIDLSIYEPHHFARICSLFEGEVLSRMKFEKRDALLICVALFLSMLPLHSDNSKRQFALLATALLCFDEVETL